MSKEKPAINPLLHHKEIAYAGELGRKRRDFCIEFIKRKQDIIKEIQDSQLAAVKAKGEKITCHKGCAHCCHFYMHANIQECEAIVYYLYNNKSVYEAFLKNYKEWRKKLSENDDIFKDCARLWYEKGLKGAGKKEELAYSEETARYRDQDLACPFLVNGACSIYEVRPYLCAGTVSSSPPEWCSKTNANSPTIYRTQTSAVYDKSFYYKELEDYIFTFFPITVYYILEGGYKMLEAITGLTDLEDAALKDPEVQDILNRLS